MQGFNTSFISSAMKQLPDSVTILQKGNVVIGLAFVSFFFFGFATFDFKFLLIFFPFFELDIFNQRHFLATKQDMTKE